MTKRLLLCVLLLAGLLAARGAAPALLDPGFEEMTAADGFRLAEATKGWWLNPAYPAKVTAFVDAHLAHSGAVCLRVMPASAGLQLGANVGEGAIGQQAPLLPGEKKRFTIWARGAGTLQLFAYRYAVGLPAPLSEASKSFPLCNDWERYELITTGLEKSNGVMVAVHVGKNSVAFLDDADFQPLGAPADAVTGEMRDVNGDGKPEVVLENSLLRLTLAPWKGGQALSLISKPGQELCLDKGVNGGLFSDHDQRQAWPGEAFDGQYRAEVSPPDDTGVSATFTYTFTGKWAGMTEPALAGLVLTKRITLTAGSPVIQVQVRVSNPTAEPKSFRYWVQHLVSASGDAAGDHYLRPGTAGVSEVSRQVNNPEFIYTPTAGWLAVTNGPRALVFTMDYDWLKTLYDCIPSSSAEWMYDAAPLAPGQTWGTTYQVLATRLADNLIYASPRLLVTQAAANSIALSAGNATAGSCAFSAHLFRRFTRFETSIAKVAEVEEEVKNGGWPVTATVALPAADSSRVPLPALPTADGLYLVRMQADAAAFEFPVVNGKTPLVYAMTPPAKQPFTARAQNVALKKDDSLDVLLVTEATSDLVIQRWDIERLINALPGKHTVKIAPHDYVHWKGSGELTNFPGTLEELCAFDVVVFEAGDASALGPADQEMLKEYVKLGGGVAVLGGFFSLGKGRCQGTTFESILPVTVGAPFDLAQAHVTIVKGAEAPVIAGVDLSAAPVVEWLQGMTPRAGATVALTAGGKPLLALGALEKGRTAAFAGTVLGDEAKIAGTPFWKWPGYPALMGNLIKWLGGF